jgi:hypothetical protein
MANSSMILGCVNRSSSGLSDVARLKLNELAIALSEEVTLEAEESGQVNMARIEILKKNGRLTFGSATGAKLVRGVVCGATKRGKRRARAALW